MSENYTKVVKIVAVDGENHEEVEAVINPTQLNVDVLPDPADAEYGVIYYLVPDNTYWYKNDAGDGFDQLEAGAAGVGNVVALANMADNSLVRGNGGAKGVQQASNILVSDEDVISGILQLGFKLTGGGDVAEGFVGWDETEGAMVVGLPGGNVKLNSGMEILLPRRADNETASIINNGRLVYISGGSGNNFSVSLADKRTHASADTTIAMATEDIAATTGKGYCTTYGLVRGDATQPIDTSTASVGDRVHLGNDGLFVFVKPSAPDAIVEVGIVFKSHSTDGAILVNIRHDKYSFLAQITKEPTGFTSPEGVIVTYDEATRKVTVTGTVNLYWRGEPVEAMVSGWVSEAHPVTLDKNYMLQYNGTAFEWVDLSSSSTKFSDAFIAFVTYGTTIKFGVREPHGVMQWPCHAEFHDRIGTYKASGADISDYILNTNVATDRRPSISESVIKDEDVSTIIAEILSDGVYPNYTLSGANGDANFNLAATDIVPFLGTQPYYNNFNGSIWEQVLLDNNRYMNIWVMQIPVTKDAQSQKYRTIFIQGQSAHASIAGAEAVTVQDINLGELEGLSNEMIVTGRFVIRYLAADWSISFVEAITGSRALQIGSPSGNYLSSVSSNSSFAGQGTPSDPLKHSPILPIAFSANLTPDLAAAMNFSTTVTSNFALEAMDAANNIGEDGEIDLEMGGSGSYTIALDPIYHTTDNEGIELSVTVGANDKLLFDIVSATRIDLAVRRNFANA